MIRRFIFAALALVASLAPGLVTPSLAEERVERFVSDVAVQRNGDLIVTETIQVWAEGRQIRRGILRDFPTLYHRADGSRVEVGFDVQSVMRDNMYEQFATERMANGVRVRIGSASVSIYTGPQGSHGTDAVVVEQKPGLIVFRTTKRLPVANGLTVAAGWDKGVVAEPTNAQRIEAILHDDPALKVAAIGGGLVIGFYLL